MMPAPLPFPTLARRSVDRAHCRRSLSRPGRTTAQGERIAVAQETGVRDKDARASAWRSVAVPVLLPILLLVVSDLVRKLFRPIAMLSSEIDHRDEQELHPIDEHHLPSKVRPFVVAINRLLNRVAQSMESQRRFVADAAHELRSPLTALSLQAERLAATTCRPSARALVPLRRGIERGRQLIDQLLTLAAQSLDLRGKRPPCMSVYRRCWMPLAECKQIDIGVESIEDVQVVFNALDLFTLVKNLVDNAIRYTPQGGRIDLSVEKVQGAVLLQVRDTGPGIAVEEQARVFDAFYRSLGSDEAGSGLGLSIVRAISERTGCRVQLAFSDTLAQRGLCVSVWIAQSDVRCPDHHSGE
jgi:two-component system OmpR family sensor kinase